MINVSHLTKKYYRFIANNNLSFIVQDGEIAVLAGPNGAGKSTAIKCIAGLLRFEGEIEIAGYSNKSIEAKRILGYVPEIPAPFELLTVWEHMEFIARAYRLEHWQERAEMLIRRMELDDKRDKMGKELSKGMQQKISICCALLIEPKVVLFDEPFVGLDPHAIKELKAMLFELKAKGVTVIISTHMLETVEEFWDKILIMMNGRVEAERERRFVEQSGENLEELFFKITEKQSAASGKT
ncbi:MAG: ABC transporter ATP-binding protein [Clostridia bacterium]|nr:ABC transporter ATP-binding protein [Clostridia bacterium]HCA55237.1 ABC transporter ATP-binding protein [Oscillospiraceae bacterium]